jgi:hypothetical protein
MLNYYAMKKLAEREGIGADVGKGGVWPRLLVAHRERIFLKWSALSGGEQ